METLSEEFKAGTLEKYEFESRRKGILTGPFRIISLSTILSYTLLQKMFPARVISSNNISPSIETLIQGLEAVVFEEDELQYRYLSLILRLLPL